MIVLDENLDEQRVRSPLASRYRGRVASIRDLRPGSVIKDEVIPALLCQHRDSIFLTTSVSDFWHLVPAHPRYCIVCAPLPNERQDELPELILSLLRHPAFRSNRQRIGKVIHLTRSRILFYESTRRLPRCVAWA